MAGLPPSAKKSILSPPVPPGSQAHKLVLACSAAFFILALSAAKADDAPAMQPHTMFGNVGIIELPSARMAPDGELTAGASFFENTQRYVLGFQALPWLETSFRYSGLQHFDPDFPVYYDRSFAVKARLWDETDILPAFAVGFNDIIGTGIYSSEYLVASKKFGDLDTSIGLGWGRLGVNGDIKNPFTLISNSYETRPIFNGAGGTNFNVYFHGPKVGLFGGAVWHTPLSGLALLAEYSSDDYSFEASRGNFKPRNQMNFGASYQVSSGIQLGLNWLYGRSIGGNIVFALDPTKPQYPGTISPPPPEVVSRSEEDQQYALNVLTQRAHPLRKASLTVRADNSAFVDHLMSGTEPFQDIRVQGSTLVLTGQIRDAAGLCRSAAQMAQTYNARIDSIIVRRNERDTLAQCTVPSSSLLLNANFAGRNTGPAIQDAETLKSLRSALVGQKIQVAALSLTQSDVVLYYTNSQYSAEKDATDRIVRVLMAKAPPQIENFRLIAMGSGIPEQEFDITRSTAERGYLQGDDPTETMTMSPAQMQNPVLSLADQRTFPRVYWSFFPQFRQALFDPVNPFAVQFLAAADGGVELARGFSINGEIEASLYDNFNKNRLSDSELPHVRSDFIRYFTNGKTGIGDFEADYRFRLSPNVFALARAGYLESMFAGAGGEVLWRPENQRWAVGVDLYSVWQRDFDRLFGLQSYRVTTGHVSMYYQSPWYDFNFAVHVGQYLAGDRGFTFEATRRFSTGVEIGAFFTKTNVPASQFGEGSFDKGLIIRIPLGWMAPIDTQGSLNMDMRPVQRDGGQRLLGDATLFNATRRTSLGEAVLMKEEHGPVNDDW